MISFATGWYSSPHWRTLLILVVLLTHRVRERPGGLLAYQKAISWYHPKKIQRRFCQEVCELLLTWSTDLSLNGLYLFRNRTLGTVPSVACNCLGLLRQSNLILPVLGGSWLPERHPGIHMDIFSSLGGHPRILPSVLPGCLPHTQPSMLSSGIPGSSLDVTHTHSLPCCPKDPMDIPGSSWLSPHTQPSMLSK